jgi:hypothetical protein
MPWAISFSEVEGRDLVSSRLQFLLPDYLEEYYLLWFSEIKKKMIRKAKSNNKEIVKKDSTTFHP